MRQSLQSATSAQIAGAVWGLAKYERLECRKGPLTLEHWNALTPRYFTVFKRREPEAKGLSLQEQVAVAAASKESNVLDDGLDLEFDFENNKDAFVACANNGWVMGWDSTKDFASPGALVYLQRQLVVWSDCVKLRYGRRPSDSPFLWNFMKRYCTESAKIFKVVRLDNCHSTPIHVAKVRSSPFRSSSTGESPLRRRAVCRSSASRRLRRGFSLRSAFSFFFAVRVKNGLLSGFLRSCLRVPKKQTFCSRSTSASTV